MKPPVLLTQPEKQRLQSLLGGPENLTILEESEFLEQTRCPPHELEPWLEEAWIQCDIGGVLAGKERVAPQPVLLERRDQKGTEVRLFYPKDELLLQNVAADGFAHMCSVINARPWLEAAEEVISQVDALTRACVSRELATIDIKLLWKALWIAICALLRVRSEPHSAEVSRLVAGVQALAEACQQRGGDQSPRARYSEAQLNSRRSLSEDYHPVLNGVPELVAIAQTISSKEVADYVNDEVGLPNDQYLDALQMMAHDGCNPAQVTNPPARVRSALTRQKRRRNQLDRERYLPLTEEEGNRSKLTTHCEEEFIVNIDWERGKGAVDLPADQSRALEAKSEGLDLQSVEARDELGWEAARVEAVRRSLEPDRRLGRRLREHFAAYKRVR